MKITTILGARPQFIKATVVSSEFAARPGIDEEIIHTGQHYDVSLSGIFFAELGLPEPRHRLEVGFGPHGRQTARMLERLEATLEAHRPDLVLVYGDTNSTLAGALASAKLHIPVAHVEAGLRSFNRRMPEEINRVITDHLSTFLYAPTETAVANLAREGISGKRVMQVGDVMFDVVRRFAAVSRRDLLDRLSLVPNQFVLATIHRAETTDDPTRLCAVVDALCKVAQRIPVVLPLHPRTRQRLRSLRIEAPRLGEIRMIEPLGYFDMAYATHHARLVVTDSGGLQKEAFFHRVPCVTLRSETEWVETVALGWNTVVPPDSPDLVVGEIEAALARPAPPEPLIDPYGGGKAAQRIAAHLETLARVIPTASDSDSLRSSWPGSSRPSTSLI